MTRDQRIVLIRHAMSDVQPNIPAPEWSLTERGRTDATELGRRLGQVGIDRVWTSHEPKAIETGNLIAAELSLTSAEVDGLDEQGLGAVSFVFDDDAWFAMIHEHFAEPRSIVIGDEASVSAGRRFADVVEARAGDGGLPAFVSHGRIIAAFLAEVTGRSAWDIWQTLQFPDAIVVKLKNKSFSRDLLSTEMGDRHV